jgi:TusA-related sulfurtransferase
VYDEIESFLPNNFGILNLSDIESGENVRIDSNDKNSLQKISSFIHNYMTDVQNKLSRSGKIFKISTKDNISKKMFQLIKDKNNDLV